MYVAHLTALSSQSAQVHMKSESVCVFVGGQGFYFDCVLETSTKPFRQRQQKHPRECGQQWATNRKCKRDGKA